MPRPLAALLAALLLLAPPGRAGTLLAGGDVQLGRWVPWCVERRGAASGFTDIRELVAGADVAFANLECVVSSRGDYFDKGERRPFLYRAPPALLDVLAIPGFDVLNTANNHAMDYGPEALLEEHELLAAAGMAAVGSGPDLDAARAPTYVLAGDAVLAFIGVEDRSPRLAAGPGRPGIFHASPERMAEALAGPIAEARAHAELVVVTPHWGANWTDAPTPERVELAHRLVELGADAIIGQSSHQLHGFEVYRGHPILYDVGTLFFDTVHQGSMRESALWLLDYDRGGFRRLRVVPLHLRSCRSSPATGEEALRVRDRLLAATRALDPELAPRWEDGALVVELEPEARPPPSSPPPRLHRAGASHPLPEPYRSRRPPEVLDAPPAWCRGEPVPLEHGVRVLCARHADPVRPGRAFVMEVVLAVSGPLVGRWEGLLAGRGPGGASFAWQHPVDDGGWIPERWEPGQVVVDRSLVRPPKLPPGDYELDYELVDVLRGGLPARRLDGQGARVPVGTLRVRRDAPPGPAGVAWGRLPAEGGGEGSLLPALAAGGALLALLLLGVWAWRRRA